MYVSTEELACSKSATPKYIFGVALSQLLRQWRSWRTGSAAYAPVLTRTNRVLEVARIFTKHSKCCDKFFVLTMSLYAFGAYFATL